MPADQPPAAGQRNCRHAGPSDDAPSIGLTSLNIVNQGAQITLGTQNVSDHDTLSLTVGATTTTFEFLNSPATETLTTATNIAVTIGASLGTTIAALNAPSASTSVPIYTP